MASTRPLATGPRVTVTETVGPAGTGSGLEASRSVRPTVTRSTRSLPAQQAGTRQDTAFGHRLTGALARPVSTAAPRSSAYLAGHGRTFGGSRIWTCLVRSGRLAAAGLRSRQPARYAAQPTCAARPVMCRGNSAGETVVFIPPKPLGRVAEGLAVVWMSVNPKRKRQPANSPQSQARPAALPVSAECAGAQCAAPCGLRSTLAPGE
jgi:hypothetical protein